MRADSCLYWALKRALFFNDTLHATNVVRHIQTKSLLICLTLSEDTSGCGLSMLSTLYGGVMAFYELKLFFFFLPIAGRNSQMRSCCVGERVPYANKGDV